MVTIPSAILWTVCKKQSQVLNTTVAIMIPTQDSWGLRAKSTKLVTFFMTLVAKPSL